MDTQRALDEIRFNTILLSLICRSPKNCMSEAQIIELGEKSGWLTQEELCSVPSRVDSKFANSIHRVAYHRDSKRNPIRLGLILWHPITSEFSTTKKGVTFLEKVKMTLANQADGKSQTVEEWLRHWVKGKNK